MKWLFSLLVCSSLFLSSCCDDCGGFLPPEPCENVYKPIALSEEAKGLLPFVNTDSMVFKHRLGGLMVYRLDSIRRDSTHYGCDTLIAQENLWMQFSTQTKLPAQPYLTFQIIKSSISDPASRELFSIKSGVDFETLVYADDFTAVNRDFKSSFHEKIINCDTAFYNVFSLGTYNYVAGGYRTIYYSKEKGVEALIGGPNSWDYFVRVY